MGKKKKKAKKAQKALALRAERLQLLSVTQCSPDGCKSQCCQKYSKCESKRCKKCPCTDLLNALHEKRELCEVA